MQGKLKDILKLMVHYYTVDISKVIGVMLKYFKMGRGNSILKIFILSKVVLSTLHFKNLKYLPIFV